MIKKRLFILCCWMACLGCSQSLWAVLDSLTLERIKLYEAERLQLDTCASIRLQQAQFEKVLLKEYLLNSVPSTKKEKQWQIHQIVKFVPQRASMHEIHRTEMLMDSLSQLLEKKPERFATLSVLYSDQKMPTWMNSIQQLREMEEVVVRMRIGEVSSPFHSPLGTHIVKLLDVKEVPVRSSEEKQSHLLISELKKRHHYQLNGVAYQEWLLKGQTTYPLFSIGKRSYTEADLLNLDEYITLPSSRRFDAFVAKALIDAESERLKKETDYQDRLSRHYNLLMINELTRRYESTHPVNEKNLRAFYEKNKSKYAWSEPRFIGAVLHCIDKSTYRKATKVLKKEPMEKWDYYMNQVFNSDGEIRVKIEVGMFAAGENKYVDKLVFDGANFKPLTNLPYTKTYGEKSKRVQVDYQAVATRVKSDYIRHNQEEWEKQLYRTYKDILDKESLKTVNK